MAVRHLGLSNLAVHLLRIPDQQAPVTASGHFEWRRGLPLSSNELERKPWLSPGAAIPTTTIKRPMRLSEWPNRERRL
jgi:hypothetical protein